MNSTADCGYSYSRVSDDYPDWLQSLPARDVYFQSQSEQCGTPYFDAKFDRNNFNIMTMPA